MLESSLSADELRSRFTGLLLGQAVGDALGLPWEGLSRRRAVKMYRTPDHYRFLFGRGMISDDTEHACMTAQALLAHPEDPFLFARSLGWKLKWWLAGLRQFVKASTRLTHTDPKAEEGALYAITSAPSSPVPSVGN